MKRFDETEKQVFRDCRRYVFPGLVCFAGGYLVCSLIAVYTAGVLGRFADAVINLDFQGGFTNFLTLSICLLINLLVDPLSEICGEMVSTVMALRHDGRILHRFLSKTYESAMSIDAGETSARIEDDPIELRCDWENIAEWAVRTPITLLYLLYSTLRISVPFTAIVLTVSAVKLSVPVLVGKTQAKFSLQEKEYRTTLRSYEMEITEKPHTIILYGLKNALLERFNGLYQSYYENVVRKSSRCNTIADAVRSWLDTFCVLLILFSGALFVSRGSMTAGNVASMAGYFTLYHETIGNIGEMVKRLPVFRDDVSRVKLLYSGMENMGGEDIPAGESCAEGSLLEADGLSFQYENHPVLNGLSFSAKRGEKIAVTGSNGSGKSTLLQILCGLRTGYEGSLKIAGKELKDVNPEAWRDCFALVQQDPWIFEGDVPENVRLGNLSAGEEAVFSVMERLGIRHLADRKLSFQDKSLSGGEKQRISIARALLKGSGLLLFDEPSNNLDAVTSAWIGDFIEHCKETVIFISHDEALIQKADRIVSL